MITVKIGNLFESNCTVKVNTVNCVGVMGKGIAQEFKKKYPDMFIDYVEKCQHGEVWPGRPYIYNNYNGEIILNFPTKSHWRSPSRLKYIQDGLEWFVNNYKDLNISSIAFPPLGCGNGGLTWNVVGPIMFYYLKDIPIEIEIYAPYGTSSYEMSNTFLSDNFLSDNVSRTRDLYFNPNWYSILYVVKLLSEQQYALKVGRIIYQKICFVMTRCGIETGFCFKKGTYGPYSAQVKDSLTILANENLITEKPLGNMIELIVSDEIDFTKKTFSDIENDAIRRTFDLFRRIKSTEHAEIIATVLYSYDQLTFSEQIPNDKELYDYIVSWKPRWNTDEDDMRTKLCAAINDLSMMSWIKVLKSNKLPVYPQYL